jgi:hypothetical protein
MGHKIEALISLRVTFLANAQRQPSQWLVELPQGFAMTLCAQPFLEWLTAFDYRGELPEPNVFQCLTPAVAGFASEVSRCSSVAYIETEYFGGIGGQAAIVYSGGRIGLAATSKSPRRGDISRSIRLEMRDYPINRALAYLGVEQTSPIDLFDSLGLGTFRTNEDWLSPPKYLRRH